MRDFTHLVLDSEGDVVGVANHVEYVGIRREPMGIAWLFLYSEEPIFMPLWAPIELLPVEKADPSVLAAVNHHVLTHIR